MSKQEIPEVLTEGLREHEAVRAWSQLQSDRAEPVSIEVLKYERKSAVYRLNGIGSDGTAVVAKRCRPTPARVQRMIYEELLPLVPQPSLRCYGFLEEAAGEFCWLFLQDAAGEPYYPEASEHRALAGGWLGRMHLALMCPGLKARLPDRGLGYYLGLLRTGRATLLDHLANNAILSAQDALVLRDVVRDCKVLEAHWSELEQICNLIPQALVHGDFAAKNVRVQPSPESAALLVFDWEHGGWGSPVIDLAQADGHVISPDLVTYCSVLKCDHPELELCDVQQAAVCGNVLRLVNEIDWINASLRFGSPRFLAKPVSTLKVYRPRLGAALRALGWN